MTNVVLCPKCGGTKVMYKTSCIVDDVNCGGEVCTCGVCDGSGWINVNDVSQDKLDTMRSLVLLSMETAENLMDECVKRADKIKEIEARCNALNRAYERRENGMLKNLDELTAENNRLKAQLKICKDVDIVSSDEIKRLQAKISSIETREYFVTTELEHMKDIAETEAKNGYEKVSELVKIVDTLATDNTRLKNIIAAYSV